MNPINSNLYKNKKDLFWYYVGIYECIDKNINKTFINKHKKKFEKDYNDGYKLVDSYIKLRFNQYQSKL